MARVALPVDAVLAELVARLREAGAVVLRAATGAGKTTRVPPAVLRAGLTDGQVVVLEPRRVAARAAARRMAEEDGSAVGDTFGYSVRFDTRAGPRTRVLVATLGVLLRRLLDDPFLESVGCVVFDEFHERGVETDLLLGMVRLLRQTVRPDLRAVVMSATLDAGPVADYLGGCPTVSSEGRTFPVEVRYRPGLSVTDGVREALAATAGDVLAFLPGVREIRQAEAALGDLPGVAVLPLYGDLSPEQQDRALRPLDRRKVVLATNVAETSVTVEGVTAVVDTGTARQQRFDPGVGMDRLVLGPISSASADQRAGRAGRTAPGVCLRLWDELSHRARPAQTEPEIRRVDLAGPALHLLAFGETDLAAFPWLDAPRPGAVAAAGELLRALGLTDGGGLTPLGREVAALPVHPRVGRLLVEGARLGVAGRAALAAAVLSDRNPFDPGPGRPTDSDLLDRVRAVEVAPRGAVFQLLQARDQLLRLVGAAAGGGDEAAFLRAVFAGWPDRLARRRGPGDRRARMVGGRGVVLHPQSGVTDAELFVCVEVDAGGVESPVRQASAVRRDWLAGRTVSDIVVSFDPVAGKVVARKQTRYGDLVLDDTPAHIPDEAEAARVLAAAAAERLDEVLPPADSDAGRFLTRVRCLKGWLPDADLPAFDDAFLRDLLEPLARGRRSLTELRAGPWLDLLRGSLTYPQLQLVEREAPDRIAVPSGSQIALTYEVGRPPVLAARIQELFGLAETPRVAGGRVKVLLHLLAPNFRPQQVTDDLASFWANGYPVVRKELRGRYPKHSWPDDPTTAEAIRGPKRRPTA